MTTQPSLSEKFIIHFGEMGGRWGISRTTAQIFAFLYISSKPMNAGEICQTLSLSRSNASIALRELEQWRLVVMSHQPGDRREYFSAVSDILDVARILVEERHRREIAPTEEMLGEAINVTPKTEEEKHALVKIEEMHSLLMLLTSWYKDMKNVETHQLLRLLKMGSSIFSLYKKTSALTSKFETKK